jgi:hypothetical protein
MAHPFSCARDFNKLVVSMPECFSLRNIVSQDPLRGGRDKMLEEIASVIHHDDPDASAQHLVVPVARRLVPEFMLTLAGRVSPF